MKQLLIAAAMMTATDMPAFADNTHPAETGSIRIRVTDLENLDGKVGVALFSTDKGFPDKPAKAMLSTVREAYGSGACEFVFDNVPCGTYAVSVLHDENGNGKMDKTFIGIPREGFGVSNNPKIKYGPPSFDEAKFDLAEAVELSVAMNYFFDDKEEKE